MIVDLEAFIARERPNWQRLDALLEGLARDPWRRMPLAEARELERLYQRAAADLARLATYAAEPQARRYLENLVARGHAEIHGARRKATPLRPFQWLTRTFPRTFRRQIRAFQFAVVLTIAGAAFGGAAIMFDADAKEVVIPIDGLQDTPAQRVAREREDAGKRLDNHKAGFSGFLMTHNTGVTLTAMALGVSWGVGTLILMVYNGVILGAVAADYILGGQTAFLLGWLMPHGVVEIPAMLVGGQAGFVLAGAMLARGRRQTLAMRMRAVVPDVVTLSCGAVLMLVWAGFVEAFLSQYHEPVIPYAVKIAFGAVELGVLVWYLARAGRADDEAGPGMKQ